MDNWYQIRKKDFGSNRAPKILALFLVLAVMFLHLNAVVCTSRSLQNFPGQVLDIDESDINFPTVVESGLRSSRSSQTQRNLLGDEIAGFDAPAAGGPEGKNDMIIPQPPPQ